MCSIVRLIFLSNKSEFLIKKQENSPKTEEIKIINEKRIMKYFYYVIVYKYYQVMKIFICLYLIPYMSKCAFGISLPRRLPRFPALWDFLAFREFFGNAYFLFKFCLYVLISMSFLYEIIFPPKFLTFLCFHPFHLA